MPVIHGVFPETLRKFGLPENVEVWKFELGEDDIEAMAGPGWEDLRVVVLAEEPPPGDIEPVEGGPREALLGGSLDVIHVEARLADHPGVMEWTWHRKRERLDLLHLEGMKQMDVARLWRGGHKVTRSLSSRGRPVGSDAMSPAEFEDAIRPVLGDLRRRKRGKFTQAEVAEGIGLSVTVLRKYLKRAGVKWKQVQQGVWPPR